MKHRLSPPPSFTVAVLRLKNLELSFSVFSPGPGLSLTSTPCTGPQLANNLDRDSLARRLRDKSQGRAGATRPRVSGAGGPARGPAAGRTHRAAVRGHVEDEEGAAGRVRVAGPFPHAVLLHQQAVGRALPLPELHRQGCGGHSGWLEAPLPAPGPRPGASLPAAPHPCSPAAPLLPHAAWRPPS